jgi:RNA polymerase sigma-70 factor, ECF subfamily
MSATASQIASAYIEQRGSLLNLGARMGMSPEDAEDMLQNSALLALRDRSQFTGRSKLSTWLYKILENATRMEYRRRGQKRNQTVSFDTPVVGEIMLGDTLRDEQPLPDGTASRRAQVKRMVITLSGLSPIYREALALYYGYELKQVEIAALLKVPIGTVKARLARGKEMMRERLADN